MRKIVLSSLLLVGMLFGGDDNHFEYKNEALRIRISQDSINRIVLPVPITGKILSAEKNLQIQINENEAYIKIIPTKKTEYIDNKPIKSEIQYAENAAEVFFTTANKTYAFVFIPDRIETRTVYIADSSIAKEDILKLEKNSSDYIKNIRNVVKAAISGELSKSFDEKIVNEKYDNFIFISEYSGVNLVVYKFLLEDVDDEKMKTKIKRSCKTTIIASAVYGQNFYLVGQNGK